MDLAQDLDFQLLEVKQGNFPPVIVVNMYNRANAVGSLGMERLRQIAFPDYIPVVFSGDWNLHHGMWEVMEDAPVPEARDLADWMVDSDFTLLNEHNEPTYQSHDQQTLSVLDLTFLNPKAVALDIVRDWSIVPELAFRL
jgi:hypothetical protein